MPCTISANGTLQSKPEIFTDGPRLCVGRCPQLGGELLDFFPCQAIRGAAFVRRAVFRRKTRKFNERHVAVSTGS